VIRVHSNVGVTTLNQNADSPEDASGLSRAVVEDQLRKMLQSPSFQRALRPARLLEFAVRMALDRPQENLPEGEIARAVYQRSDFDPKLDPIVRVDMARLRRRVAEYYQGEGKNDPVEIKLPQRGYKPEIFVRVGGVVSIPAAAGVDDSTMRLAVLPFANLSEDSAMEAFCEGLTEEVIASVTDLAHINVVARTSAVKYKQQPIDIRRVGQELGVTHVMEGTARQGENQLRVTAKLVNCETGFTEWSKTLEHEKEGDPLVLQACLGGLIAETLAEKVGTVKVEDSEEQADCGETQ
jgi:TolB-like protein